MNNNIYYITLIEAVKYVEKSKPKLLEFIIKWLLRYYSVDFLLLGKFLRVAARL